MTRTPATDRIVKAAIAQFAVTDYAATSMANIAEQVGIQKASLYAHFNSKDALFMEAFQDVVGEEQAFVSQHFQQTGAQGLPGLAYCQSLIDRYYDSAALQFFLRTSYMPPPALASQIDARHEAYLSQLDAAFVEQLPHVANVTDSLISQHERRYALAYLGIIDSLQVKLIYTNASLSQLRLSALFSLLETDLNHHFTQINAK